MTTWLLAIGPLLAVAVSIYGIASQQRAKKEQREIRAAVKKREELEQERTQQWREMRETIDVLSEQVDLANNRLLQCQEREAGLRRRLDALEAR